MRLYLESIAGVVLVLLFLADVFLTVLYARLGTGIFNVVVAKSCGAFFAPSRSIWVASVALFFLTAGQ
jgi:hypothetical protein